MYENVNVCITPKGDKPILHFSQFDNENVFTVTVLADDGESAAVLTGLDIEFRLRKTDSHVVTIAPESVADNVITFKTTEQMCACCGQNIATVTLMKDDMVVSTLDILVDIQRDILSGGLTSESDIRNLTTQIEQIVPEVVGDDYYNKQEVDDLLAEHTFDPTNYYNKSDVDGLLADKADADDVYTKSDVYNKIETDNLLSAKMDNIGYHGIVDEAAVISFTTDCNAPLDIIKGNITPVQDLHGYSKPWSGGGGKNKLNITATTQTINGITFTIDNEGVITTSGTFSENTNLAVTTNFFLKAGTYILNGCPSGGSYSKYVLRIENGSAQRLALDTGSGEQFTLSEDTYVWCRIYLYSSDGIGKTFKPMVRLATESDATFEPYSNICPISGFSALNVTLADGDMQPVDTKTVNFGQTVYGGVADVTNGKVTVTHKFITLDGTEAWTQSGNSAYINNTDAKIVNEYGNGISDQYEFGTWGDVTGAGSYGKFTIYKNTAWTAAQIAFALGTQTLADFKTALSNNPLTVLYELATPIEISTTPETVSSISGDNNIFIDTGNMTEIAYFENAEDNLIKLIKAYQI